VNSENRYYNMMMRLAILVSFLTVRVSAEWIVVSPNGTTETLAAILLVYRAAPVRQDPLPSQLERKHTTSARLFLGPEDSDTIWEAPHGEHPVISRSRVISDWAKDAGAASWG
jgi:hypothetical protein